MKKSKSIMYYVPVLTGLIVAFVLIHSPMAAQDTLPYYQIPDPPEQYTAGGVVSRMVDGLGFRYHWATEGLTESDLDFKPGETNRTLRETLDHIFGLSEVILNAALKKPNETRPERPDDLPGLRAATLNNLKKASTIFLQTHDLADHTSIFNRASGVSEFPFWNMINGPIEDAVWHCGQVVSYRRASGNPMPSGVSVFQGIKRNN